MFIAKSKVLAMIDDDDKWYYTRKELEKNSPSRKDGISFKKENRLRRKCILLIVQIANRFEIYKSVTSTASVYCHRFFIRRSFSKHKWYRIAIASMFLASKVVERRIWLDTFREEGWGETLKEVFQKEIPLNEHKKMIIDDEREILVAVDFEIIVRHPYSDILMVVKQIKGGIPMNVCRAVLEFIDESYFTYMCLQFKPLKIVGASFHYAYQLLKLKLPFQEQDGYRSLFQMTLNEAEDISSQMADSYEYLPLPLTVPDNQIEPSSSQPGNQSLSASASTSAPPRVAAPGRRQTISNPRTPVPGKRSLPTPSHPRAAPTKYSRSAE